MSKARGEMVDHLLLHCLLATKIWSFFFSICGIQCCMAKQGAEFVGMLDGALWQSFYGRGLEDGT